MAVPLARTIKFFQAVLIMAVIAALHHHCILHTPAIHHPARGDSAIHYTFNCPDMNQKWAPWFILPFYYILHLYAHQDLLIIKSPDHKNTSHSCYCPG